MGILWYLTHSSSFMLFPGNVIYQRVPYTCIVTRQHLDLQTIKTPGKMDATLNPTLRAFLEVMLWWRRDLGAYRSNPPSLTWLVTSRLVEFSWILSSRLVEFSWILSCRLVEFSWILSSRLVEFSWILSSRLVEFSFILSSRLVEFSWILSSRLSGIILNIK